MTRDATTAFARTLVDEWTRHGITDACLAPGLALGAARARARRRRAHPPPRVPRRALGRVLRPRAGPASGRPAPLLCTSGTAAANFHPAVLEAHHGRVPMIVCTADRPPELRDAGAGQTVDQLKLYGDAVRWFHEADVPGDRPGVGAEWRALASRSVAEARRRARGARPPEPAVPRAAGAHRRRAGRRARSVRRPSVDGARARASGPRRSRCSTRSAHLVADRPRGLVVAGWGAGVRPATVLRFAEAAGWPVLADPLSNLRVPGTVATYDPLLRVPGFADDHRPDVVLRIGAPTTNKVARAVARARRRPGARRSRRRVARPAARGERSDGRRSRAAARRAGRRGRRDGRPRVGGALDHRRRAGARRDRRADRRLGRAVRGPGRARRGRRGAGGRRARDRVEHAGPRRRELRPGARRRHASTPTAASTASTASCRPRSASRPAPTRRWSRWSAISASCTTATACSVRPTAASTPRSSWSTTAVVASSRSCPRPSCPSTSRRCSARRSASTSARSPRCTGSRSSRSTTPPRLEPAVQSSVEAGGVRVVRVRTDRARNVTRHREVWAAVADSLSG